ncbi:MAG: 50S ribosomal protein L32 [Candidatus Omnitrophota bacterium]
MPNPKRRHSRSRRDKRRSANSCLDTVDLSVCPECKMPKKSHRICPHCGYYKGRQVVKVGAKEEKKKK